MSQQLVSHNEDLRLLVERGYAIAFDSNHLVVRDIPYLDADRQLRWGAIVTKLDFIDQDHITQSDHQIFFAGSAPHGLDGSPIPNLGGGSTQLLLGEACSDVVVERSFSNKPTPSGRFRDFFEKIESYVTIICGPAMELYDVNPYSYRSVEEGADDPIFKFRDTLTSRAEIGELSAKFRDDVVAVIGLGGTGAYLLDFLVRTPIREIRAFDLDTFHVHNAFRSPGATRSAELGRKKTQVYRSRYRNFRAGLSIVPKLIDASCSKELEGVTFAFVCVDNGPSRAGIFDLLISKGIPYIDVGMGLSRRRGSLSGMVRMTYYSAEKAQETRDQKLAEESESPDDAYRTNIQIGELNALNACLAIIRFKQLRGFYCDDGSFYHVLFNLGDLRIATEPDAGED